MIAYIVSEGLFDAQLLKGVLPGELLENVEIVPAGGVSAAKSLARSLLVRRQVPVAIVVDADSVAPDLVQERIKNIEEIVESVSVNTPVKVILAVPELEIIFFQDSLLLSHLLGYVPSQDILNLAAFQPRKALEQLLSQSEKYHSRSQIVNQLANEDIEILRKAPVIQEVIHFLQSVREPAKVH
jgi:hypothetical protein